MKNYFFLINKLKIILILLIFKKYINLLLYKINYNKSKILNFKKKVHITLNIYIFIIITKLNCEKIVIYYYFYIIY